MDDSDLVYFDVDAATITAASLTLGKDEGELVESLSNHASYEGRRLRTNVHAPGALRRGEAWGILPGHAAGTGVGDPDREGGVHPLRAGGSAQGGPREQPFQPEGF